MDGKLDNPNGNITQVIQGDGNLVNKSDLLAGYLPLAGGTMDQTAAISWPDHTGGDRILFDAAFGANDGVDLRTRSPGPDDGGLVFKFRDDPSGFLDVEIPKGYPEETQGTWQFRLADGDGNMTVPNNITAARHVTKGGTPWQLVLGDGSLLDAPKHQTGTFGDRIYAASQQNENENPMYFVVEGGKNRKTTYGWSDKTTVQSVLGINDKMDKPDAVPGITGTGASNNRPFVVSWFLTNNDQTLTLNANAYSEGELVLVRVQKADPAHNYNSFKISDGSGGVGDPASFTAEAQNGTPWLLLFTKSSNRLALAYKSCEGFLPITSSSLYYGEPEKTPIYNDEEEIIDWRRNFWQVTGRPKVIRWTLTDSYQYIEIDPSNYLEGEALLVKINNGGANRLACTIRNVGFGDNTATVLYEPSSDVLTEWMVLLVKGSNVLEYHAHWPIGERSKELTTKTTGTIGQNIAQAGVHAYLHSFHTRNTPVPIVSLLGTAPGSLLKKGEPIVVNFRCTFVDTVEPFPTTYPSTHEILRFYNEWHMYGETAEYESVYFQPQSEPKYYPIPNSYDQLLTRKCTGGMKAVCLIYIGKRNDRDYYASFCS
jgi:hypothetical protein